MHYSCDIDVVKPSFAVQTSAKLYADISKEMALLWQKPNLFMSTEYALRKGDEQGSFIVQDGVMIVNITLMQIDRVVHMLHKLPEGLEIKGASDDRSVDLVFTLISPEHDGPLHLRRLSRATRLLHDRDFCTKLREAESADVVRTYFMYPDELEERAA